MPGMAAVLPADAEKGKAKRLRDHVPDAIRRRRIEQAGGFGSYQPGAAEREWRTAPFCCHRMGAG
jgi:hypothetical protein